MHPTLNRNLFFIQEHTGVFKAANHYDVLDPDSKQPLLYCREVNLNWFTKIVRFTDYKRMTPFTLEITTPEGKKVLTVKRSFTFFRSSVEVYDEADQLVGVFKQSFFSIGGKFNVQDANGNQLCTLKGKWTSWEFAFLQGQTQFAQVTKKWAGFGKEFFTTADNYILHIENSVLTDNKLRLLIMAAVLCIDMVLKE
jgi:uncharacterized protein YxjI